MSAVTTLQVRSEDLLTDGARVLEECLAFCELTTDREECQRIYDRLQLSQVRQMVGKGSAKETGANVHFDPLLWSGEVVRRLVESPAEPPGFVGEGRSGQSVARDVEPPGSVGLR